MTVLFAHLGTGLITIGAAAFVIGGLGLLRLPDFYARLSAVTIAGGTGTCLVLVGLLLHYPGPANALKITLAVLIQLATAAVGGNAMARAGYLTRTPQSTATKFDELAAGTTRQTPPRHDPACEPRDPLPPAADPRSTPG
ncbi:cation:proton antiporter [Nocardiopsis ansamitocini]|uniref:Multicomponent Na+:H+ antiporter subunit G n=1 Tax=Nocardiopsis ansamitocini TaxID=1670832 RepID=A0A9W6UGN5_9ACTN|nr:monovalent cation/H(+) antiporter subunit G [Nocardiopsis ansamitocini]GLU47821.1 hypothetical protein Nans01_21720 [Nocardiopsis ansamitocini]